MCVHMHTYTQMCIHVNVITYEHVITKVQIHIHILIYLIKLPVDADVYNANMLIYVTQTSLRDSCGLG